MVTINSVNNQTMLHVEDLTIIEPWVNVALMIEHNNSNNENVLSALSSMDVALLDRKISATNHEQSNAATHKNTHLTDMVNNAILDSENDWRECTTVA